MLYTRDWTGLDLSVTFNSNSYGDQLGWGLGLLSCSGSSSSWVTDSRRCYWGDICLAPFAMSGATGIHHPTPTPLFNIYMKSLKETIQSFGVGCHQYVDDI